MIKKFVKSLQNGLTKVGVQLANSGVVDFAAATDKEQYVFVVGRFQSGTDDLLNLGVATGRNGDKAQSEIGIYVLRILAKRYQRLAAKVGEFRFLVNDAADATGCHEAAVLVKGIEKDEHFSVGVIRDQMTFKHVLVPVGGILVCEGVGTAMAAKSLF